MSNNASKDSDGTTGAGTTRRKFLLTSAAGAGAVVTAIGAGTNVLAGVGEGIPSIRIPKEIPTSLNEAPKPGSFEGKGMTGAEVFAKLCKEEELAALFCCPGNYTVINAMRRQAYPATEGEPKARCARLRMGSRG
jgi:hypothetical protein